MRKLLILIFAVSLIAGCVSNRTFRAERERIGRIEFQQWKDIENLNYLREEYIGRADSLDYLMAQLDSELGLLREDLISLNTGIMEVRGEFADYTERNDAALIATMDRIQTTGDRINQIDSQMAQVNALTEAQRQELAQFRQNYEATATFNEDVMIDFDQGLEALRENLAVSQAKLDTIDQRYTEYAADYAEQLNTTQEMVSQMEVTVQGDLSRLSRLQETHNQAVTQTDTRVQGTVERIEALERQMQREHHSTGELIAIVQELEGNINQVQQMVMETNNRIMASMDSNRNETSAQLADMNNRLEQMRTTLAATRNEMSGELGSVSRQVSGVASELAVVANDLEAVTSGTARGRAQTDRVVNSYNNAKAYYDRHNYEEAIVRLEAFVNANPNHDYVPNALYWIAESYYAGRNFPKAIRAFMDVVDRYPTHAKAQDAKIKLAMCYSRQGDNELAKTTLTSFKTEYPAYHNMRLVNRILESLN